MSSPARYAPRSVPRTARSLRSGFTISECVVAATLLGIGLVALSSSALAVQRLTNAAASRARAAALGAARLELLRGAACAHRMSGASSSEGITEHWIVAPAPGLTGLQDSLALPPDRGRAAPPLLLAETVPC